MKAIFDGRIVTVGESSYQLRKKKPIYLKALLYVHILENQIPGAIDWNEKGDYNSNKMNVNP